MSPPADRLLRPLLRPWSVYRTAYSGLPHSAWLLAAVECVNRSGSMVLFFLVLYMTRRLGFSVSEAGWVMSGYGVGSLAGSYLGGWACDRLGPTRVQQGSLALAGVTYLVMEWATTFSPLLALTALLGVASAATYPANQAAMARVCAAELRARGMALLRVAANVGVTIGPVVGGYLALHDYRLLFRVDGATCLAAWALLLLLASRLVPAPSAGPASPDRPDAHGRDRSPWRDWPFLGLLVLVGVQALVFVQFFNAWPLYLRQDYQLTEDRIGQLVAVNTGLIVALEMVVVHALRRAPTLPVIACGCLLFCSGFGLLPFGRSFAFGAASVALWSFGEMLTMPMLAALAAGRGSEARRGSYLGLFSVTFSVALVAGPALGGWIYGRLGGDAIWYAVAGLGPLLAAGYLGLARAWRRAG